MAEHASSSRHPARPPVEPRKMAEPRKPAEPRKALARLLRLALSGPLNILSEQGADLVLGPGSGSPRTIAASVLAEAVAGGLLLRQGRRILPTAETHAWLKRALAAEGLEDGFLAQHREEEHAVVPVDGVRSSVRRNVMESPLSGLVRLKEKSGAAFLPREALDAGERLAADFERGGLQPKITASWEPRLSSRTPGGVGAAEIGDVAIAARRRVAGAIEAMGPELAGVALDVCCFAKGLELVERERQWPARSAKLMLRTALLALARHYAPPPPRRKGPRHWGTEDFRPVM